VHEEMLFRLPDVLDILLEAGLDSIELFVDCKYTVWARTQSIGEGCADTSY